MSSPGRATRSRILLPALALALFVVYFLNLGSLPFVGADEPRYARIGEEMLVSADLVTPTLNFRPWLEKPPLLFWLEAASFKLFGISEFTARFPVALLGLLTALGCSLFLNLNRSRRAAGLGLLILSTSPLFFIYSRAASTDMPLAAFLTFSLLLAFRAQTRGRMGPALAAGAALGMAVLAKGPVALLLGFGVLLGFRLLAGRPLWKGRQVAVGLLAAGTVSFPWFWLAWKANGYDFLATFVLNHNLARYLTDLHHHAEPFWFFLPVLLLGAFPWILFLVSALVRGWRNPDSVLLESDGLQLYLWLWVLIPLLFFSLGESKLAGYILPVLPPLSMLAALEWDRLLSSELTALKMLRVELSAVSALAIFLGVALLVATRIYYGSAQAGLLLGVPLLACGILLQRPRRGYSPRGLFAVLAGSMVLFVAMAYWQAAPALAGFHSSKALMLEARDRLSPARPIIFYRFFHHTALYYSGYQAIPEPIPDLESLQAYFQDHPQPGYLILTQKSGFSELSANLAVRRFQVEGNQFLVEVAAPE